MIHEFNHFGIVVRNLDASLAFYQNLMGAQIVYRGYIPPSKTDVIYLLIAGGLIELLHPAEPRENETFGITHLAFMSDALDEDYRRLTDLGYTGLVAPKTAGSGVGRLAFLSDPNGARIELIQRDLRMRDNPVVHPVIKSFDHYSLLANDLDGALRLYRDVMGMKVLSTMSVPHPDNPLTIVYLHWDYDVLELLHRPTPVPGADLYGHFALRVDDLDAALATFAAQGVNPEPGMPKRAGTGHGRLAIIRDPDGVRIELVERSDLRELTDRPEASRS
jgi:catechol 2,3-dioxygenase-like lactoylglutathione lyase family enzyme